MLGADAPAPVFTWKPPIVSSPSFAPDHCAPSPVLQLAPTLPPAYGVTMPPPPGWSAASYVTFHWLGPPFSCFSQSRPSEVDRLSGYVFLPMTSWNCVPAPQEF